MTSPDKNFQLITFSKTTIPMKKFRSIVLTIVALSFLASCGKDDEGGDISSSLIGVWSFTNVEIQEFTINGQDFVEYFVQELGLTEAEAEEIALEFEESAEADAGLANVKVEFKADNTFKTTETGEPDETGTWSLSDDGKTLTIDDEEFTVKTLTSSQMVLAMEQEETEEGMTIKIAIEFTFTK